MAGRTYSNGRKVDKLGGGLVSRLAEVIGGPSQPRYGGAKGRGSPRPSPAQVPVVCAAPAGVITLPLDPAAVPPGQIAIVIPRPREATADALSAGDGGCKTEQ